METYTVVKFKTKNYKIRKFFHFSNKSPNDKQHILKCSTEIEDFLPSEIIFSKWTKYNEPDEILFRTKSGNIYLVLDNNLLREISLFAKLGAYRQHPVSFVHIEGKQYFECYEKPENALILRFLKKRINDYDIFTPEGEIVKKALTAFRRYNVC